MNLLTRPTTPLGALTLLAALTTTAPALAAPTVAITGPSAVTPGTSFQLVVAASGFTDLYAYQFDVTYNPVAFGAVGATAGSFLGSAGGTFFDGGVIDNGTGAITLIFESLVGPLAGASGDGDLVELTFDAIGPRFSGGAFTIANFIAVDSQGQLIDVDLRSHMATIPEPSTLVLALALAGLALRRTGGRGQRANGEVASAA